MKIRISQVVGLRPAVLIAVVAVGLVLAGVAQYSVGAIAEATIQPTSTNQPAPVITSPSRVLGAETTQPAAGMPKLALSFDDGPNPLTTPLIVNTLEQEHVHASFFVVGSRVAGNEALLRREYADGDDVGNHSWSHPNFGTLNRQQILAQVNQTERAIAAAGVPAPFMLRPPYGDLGPNFPKNLPLAIVLWNIDPKDWDDHNAAQLTQRIIAEARPGGIIDLHGIYLATAQAIGPAIDVLKQRYDLVTVSQLLGIKPGTIGIYYGYK